MVGTTNWFMEAFFDQPTLENFCATLRQLPPGVIEIMTHPAIDAPELYSMYEGYREQRPRELAVLVEPAARIEVERQEIQLISFSRNDLKRAFLL